MKRAKVMIVLIAAGMVCGAGAGYLGGLMLKGHRLPPGQEAWLLAALVGSLFLAIALHELGHVIGGLMGGMSFGLYIAGPLRVAREEGRIQAGWNRSLSLAGGMAAMFPTDTSGLRERMLTMVAGGPGASLVWAAVCGMVAIFAGGDVFVRISALIAGSLSACILVATAVPMAAGQFNSDGARIRMLLKGGFAADRWVALSALMGQTMSGARPRELNLELVELAARESEANYDAVSAALTAYQVYLDRGETERAGGRLDWAVAHRDAWPKAFQPILSAQAAFHAARFRGDAAKAREHLTGASAPSALPLKRSLLLAEAATLRAEGRLEEARAKAEEGLRVRGDRTGSHIVEGEWLSEIAQAGLPRPATAAR